MATYSTSLKTWGSAGQEFPDNYNYVEGEQPVDAWDNYFNHHTYQDLTHLINLTNARFADEDGTEAGSGGVRLQNQEWLAGRNNADDGDINLWQVNSGDEIRAGAVVRLDDDLRAVNGEIIWDESADEIPDARLPSTITRDTQLTDVSDNGSLVASQVGDINFTGDLVANDDGDGTVTVDFTEHSRYTDAEAQDAVGGMAVDGLNYDDPADELGLNVVESGQVQLSNGEATVSTNLSTTDATFYPAIGVDDPGQDTQVSAYLRWDDSANAYDIKFVESETTVGNPTVNYDIVRVR